MLFALPRTVPVLAAVPERLTAVVEQPVEGHYLHHLRGGAGEGAGLIEHDGICLRQRFQILAAL